MNGFRRPGRVAGGIAAALAAAALLALSPLLASSGERSLANRIASLEASYDNGAGHPHWPSAVDARADRTQRVRCAQAAYRLRNPHRCPARAPTRRAFDHAAASQIGRWTGRGQTDSLAINSILLPTGKVMWFAYPRNPKYLAVADRESINYSQTYIWDPATGRSVRRDAPVDPRTGRPYNIWCSGQTLLRDGRLLVAGGNLQYDGTSDFKGLDVVLTFDPFTETWTKQPDMRDGRWYPTLTLLPDGRVVIVGGLDSSGTGNSQNADVEVFTPSPARNGVGSIERKASASRTFGLYPHLLLVPGGRLLLAGPGPGDTALLDTGSWTWRDVTNLPFRREWGSATLLPSGAGGPAKILLNGGSNTAVDYSNAPATATSLVADIPTLLATPTAPGLWQAAPSNVRARSHLNTTILPDGTLLATGGGLGSSGGNLYPGPVYTAELRSPATGAWTEVDAQVDARTYHSTSVLLPDGRVVSAGDDRSEHQPTAARTYQFYSPPYLYRGARPAIASAPAGVPYGASFGLGTGDPGIVQVSLLRLGATTHALDVDQRLLALPFSAAAGGLAATAPADPTAAPPGYYQLFLVNSAGAVSPGRVIRLDNGIADPSDAPMPAGGGPGAGGAPGPGPGRAAGRPRPARRRAPARARAAAGRPGRSGPPRR